MFLKRDTLVFLVKGSDIWEIPVMDGFTFSQANTITEIELKEMATPAGVSRRGRKVFNDALAPAQWSFSTYVRPFASAGSGTGKADSAAGKIHAVEEALWANFVGLGTYSAYSFVNFNIDTTDLDIVFTGGNNITLGTFDLYFVLGAALEGDLTFDAPDTTNVVVYKIASCIVNEAVINFDVSGIAMIDWKGMGSVISKQSTFDATGVIVEGITSTTNFIRNKLTSLTLTAANSTTYPGTSADGIYNITLTGGSITFTNNAEFLTPATLGVVNRPIGHIAGSKNVTGNFTAYLEEGAGKSEQLLTDALADLTTVTNSFALAFILGGTGNTPRMEISLPTAHLEIPVLKTDDVIAVDISFHGIPSDISSSNEAVLKYVA